MKVTAERQITIPLEIVEKTGLKPGTNVEIYAENGAVVIRKAGEMTRGEILVQRMTGAGTIQMTTDEIMAMTRGED